MKYVITSLLAVLVHSSLFCQSLNSEKPADSLAANTLYEAVVQDLGHSPTQRQKFVNMFLDTKYENLTSFNSQGTDQSQFRVVQTRVYLKGDYKDKISYGLRYRLNEKDASNALEFAFLEYHFNPNWTISMGKMFTAWGSMELSYNSADLYMFSNIINSIELFSPGVSVTYKTHGQSFKFQVISPGEQFASQAYKDKAYAGLFLWEGKLFKDILKTRYGYGLFQHNANKYYSWVTLGNQISINDFAMELDWIYGYRNLADPQFALMNDQKNPTINYVKDNVVMATFKYKINKVTPLIKVMHNYRQDINQGISYVYSGISGVVEYNPFSDPAFSALRLFAAYNFYNYKYKQQVNPISDNNQSQVAIGVRWMVPIF
ncbi:porin [Myroides sp. LJL119]